ncbi:MAG: response regulator [Gemmataceae bacterium]
MPKSSSYILLVDDDPTNRQMMSWIFRNSGYLVREAATGTEALREAQSHVSPDLIVLDVNLPDISGFEVCRQLRAKPETSSIAVVHLSAVHVGSEARTQGLDQGADAYLIKPVDPGELLATVRAILRIRQAEEAARRAASEWRATFDALSDAVAVVDKEGIITRGNRALSEMLGIPITQLVGLRLEPTLRQRLCTEPNCAPLDWLLNPSLVSRLAEEVKLGRRYLHIVVDPIAGGGSVVIIRDITHHREMEEQIRRGQRLEAIGQLSAGVAHELNNLLAVVMGNLSMVSGQNYNPSERQALESAHRSVFRVAELTQQLLGFSQQTLLWLQPVQTDQVVAEALEELGGELPSTVRLKRSILAPVPMIQADPKLLKLVVLQLCRRALNCMPHGGELRVTVQTAELNPLDKGPPQLRCGSFVHLQVGDTGKALSKEAVQQIFEPFHSLAGPQGGLALGMVRGIVKQHLGWIECTSTPGQGTYFDIYLPALTESLPSSKPIPAKLATRPGPRRILLAEDNETLLHLASRFLRQDGYEVMTANNGQQALELFEREAGRIDLVILDQVMPECSGSEALSQMRQRLPRLRALIATDTTDCFQLNHNDIQGIVSKPYREHELLLAVRQALAVTPLMT